MKGTITKNGKSTASEWVVGRMAFSPDLPCLVFLTFLERHTDGQIKFEGLSEADVTYLHYVTGKLLKEWEEMDKTT